MAARTPRFALLGRTLALLLGLLALAPAAGRAATISQVGQSTAENGAGAATVTINVPAGVQAGDVLHLGLQSASGVAIPVPPGWSTEFRLSAWYGYGAGFYKVASASEPLSFTFDVGTTTRATAAIS